jgi:predicted nucleic-acid-binding Zn-ribbon protein
VARNFLCYHCRNEKDVPGRPFVADGPKCPNCGLDAAADKQVAHLIVPLKTIHFEAPHAIVAGVGSGSLACGTKPGGVMVSREIVAVNCPKCLASEAGQKAHRATAATGDEFEVEAVIDPEKQQYVKA